MMDHRPNIFQQFFDLSVGPEIARRQALGELPSSFQLHAAQILCFSDGRPNCVRLNAEVRAMAQVKLREGVTKGKGENLFTHEIEGYETVILPETEDPDCGHATMLKLGGQWFVVFDFRYNRGKSAILLDRAREFFVLGESALARKAWSSFVYVLFTAAELAVRAELLLVPDRKFEQSKRHGATIIEFNRWAYLGNAPSSHKDALNRLSLLRPDAGYATTRFSIDPAEADALIKEVNGIIEATAARLA